MHVPDDVVTEEPHHPLDALTDDGRAQMADMKFLGDIGPAVVDNDPLRSGRHCAKPIIQTIDVAGKVFIGERDVDESWPGELQLAKSRGVPNRCKHSLPDLTRVPACGFGGRHRPVALELGEIGASGDDDLPEGAIEPLRLERIPKHL